MSLIPEARICIVAFCHSITDFADSKCFGGAATRKEGVG